MKTGLIKRTLWMAILSSIAIGAFADDAPVYDIQNFPPQFDGGPSATTREADRDQARSEQIYAPKGGLSEGVSSPASDSSTSLTLSQRVGRIEQQINNMNQSELSAKVGDLNSQLQSLRGQIEELSHQIQQLQSQQKAMYSDLDKRISSRRVAADPAPDPDPVTDSDSDSAVSKPVKSKLKSKAKSTDDSANVASASSSNEGNQPNVAEEHQIYQTAYNLIKAKKYSQAASTLQAMLKKYPTGQFAAIAHCRLGEIYTLMGKNDEALEEFKVVVKSYPDSPRVADAQLSIGYLYSLESKWPEAKSAFKKVINNYPGTGSARLAAEQLKKLKQAGH